jgi:hypothetical protein
MAGSAAGSRTLLEAARYFSASRECRRTCESNRAASRTPYSAAPSGSIVARAAARRALEALGYLQVLQEANSSAL